jgi:hypothetical protein
MANKSNNPGRLFTGDSSTYRGKPKPLVPFGSLDRVNRSNLVDPMSEDDSARFDIAKEAERRGVPVQRILDERAMAAARGPKRQSPEPNRLMVTDEDGTRIATPDEVGIQDFSGDIKEETARKDMDEAERLRGSIARVEDQLRNAKTIEKKQKLTRALKNLNAKFSTVTQTEAERDASSVAAADRKYLRREEVRRELARRSIERRINRGVDPRIIDRHNEGAAGRGVDRFIAPEEVGLSRRVPEDGEIIEGKTGPSRVQSDGQGSPVEVPVQETADGSYVIDGSAMPPEQFQEHYKASDGRAFRSEIYRNGGAFADRQRRIDSGRMALLDDDLDEDAKAEGQAALDEREAALHYEFSKRVGSRRPVVDSSKKTGKGGDDEDANFVSASEILEIYNEESGEEFVNLSDVPAGDRERIIKNIRQRRLNETTGVTGDDRPGLPPDPAGMLGVTGKGDVFTGPRIATPKFGPQIDRLITSVSRMLERQNLLSTGNRLKTLDDLRVALRSRKEEVARVANQALLAMARELYPDRREEQIRTEFVAYVLSDEDSTQ